ncbi:MAG: hypothetical protein LBS59_03685 [Puniceicoccales bacterium]|jgi:hypothetical protein|nr:hypothetical protein [Puniceicoccales bacterium]
MDTPSVKQIICIKWGTFYNARYVNTLYGMIARNISGAFTLTCFTDDTTDIRKEVNCLPLPELRCSIPPEIPGKWRKTALWGAELFGMKGVALFIDLDSIIIGNIDDYFTFGEPDDVITVRNWVKPLRRLGQTTVFRFTIGQHAYMLDNLRADPERISRKYVWEQCYVTNGVRGGIKFWPSSWTRHFRVHCLPFWPLRYFKEPVFPKNAKIIACPGGPNPPDVIQGHWEAGGVYRPPWKHIRHVWENRDTLDRKWTLALKQFVRPTAWVAEHWREN